MNVFEEMPMHTERELPVFSLRQEDLPELLTWQVGGKYYLVMKVEMVGLEKMSSMEQKSDQSKMEGRFAVHSIRALDTKPVDAVSLERDEWNRTVAKVKSGEY